MPLTAGRGGPICLSRSYTICHQTHRRIHGQRVLLISLGYCRRCVAIPAGKTSGNEPVAKTLPIVAAPDRVEMQQPVDDCLVRCRPCTKPVRPSARKKPLAFRGSFGIAAEMREGRGPPSRHTPEDVISAVCRLDRPRVIAAQELDICLVGPLCSARRERQVERRPVEIGCALGFTAKGEQQRGRDKRPAVVRIELAGHLHVQFRLRVLRYHYSPKPGSDGHACRLDPAEPPGVQVQGPSVRARVIEISQDGRYARSCSGRPIRNRQEQSRAPR